MREHLLTPEQQAIRNERNKRKSALKAESKGEAALIMQVKALGLPVPQREFMFHADRRWRFDFAWPAVKLACEVEGGVYSQGRHTRGSGFEMDAVKYAEAVADGWRVLRFSTGQVLQGIAINYVEKILGEVTDAT